MFNKNVVKYDRMIRQNSKVHKCNRIRFVIRVYINDEAKFIKGNGKF